MEAQEIKRRHRVTSQMITMHARMRDRYRRRAIAVDSGLVLAALLVLIAGTGLLSEFLGIERHLVSLIDEFGSVVILALAIVSFRADWKGSAQKHQSACQTLSDLLAGWKAFLDGEEFYQGRPLEVYRLEDDRRKRDLTPLPENKFTKLKAAHLRKVEVSRILDRYPGAWTSLLHARLFLRDTGRALGIWERQNGEKLPQ